MADIFGLLGVTDYDVARRMTLKEYSLRMRGYFLSYLDKEYFIHLQAMANRNAKATNKKGEYMYKEMSDFYDRQKRYEELFGKRTKMVDKRLIQRVNRLREFREGGN
ncbi:TPA: hypothetical protein VB845_001063 [Streptococcus suis]|nr:hypothetical protein [Streptococcus suis]